ncbi:SWIB complex BAF60b domain-containing protein, putative isoform 3 [Hibiscus syriacus]|uniref:SWIB complex BAF60b domain-containing protein, putative isoform 3 n=2 Tax=Hibiscus syriacus TaxID=106335 RepID=A0A6A2YUZ4_HIBSY|nr:SWIB complex BAF60b domain-containing protein, putative isoform 3 [Hibiscus syriacus]
MSVVSDQEIAREVEALLRQSDPTGATTLNGVLPPTPSVILAFSSYGSTTAAGSAAAGCRESQVFSENAATVAIPEVAKESAPAGTKRRGGPGGLNKVCRVSPALQVVVGEPALPRTEIVKQLWEYIRKNSLQDPSNKRKIICDDALRLVFETDCTYMFKMNKLLAKHITAFEPSKESSQTKQVQVDSTKTESVEPSASPFIISEALSKFLDAGGREMLATEAERRVWEYIKVNHLEDPVNPMVVLCNDKLCELLGCESISVMGIHDSFLHHHLFKHS